MAGNLRLGQCRLWLQENLHRAENIEVSSTTRAAQIASKAGCAVVVANGRKGGVLTSVLAGEDTGTLILSSPL